MKQLLTLLLFSSLVFFGCNQESEITSPVDTGPILNKKLIELLPSSGLTVETQTFDQNINGAVWTEFQRSYEYLTSSGGTINQIGDLDFFPGAFSGTKNITMTFNTGGAAMDFGPAMQFQAVVEYTYRITGLDLTGVNPNTLDFVYIDANGDMYPVDYSYVTMNENTGMLMVKDAILPHFSRYGFVN
ncbi:MAG: DUF3857 domain-containing protein [Ignavibacteria bacterium]|nr:DUF3857 domain-containing protein [Ignavibacteria bacterium]MBT8382871.1 DUF3857 domain-containing protein [Ignavibacteria bacterium]MBT8392640.1 DUF3857 domain-containing protein [Ignavibacteria bacterium]NNJ51975.1 hypothetical protein [Ignavibacteriaceae bacterium]NNL22094.1 hypothetical protein [Ignavibacteriaceae bacterium]